MFEACRGKLVDLSCFSSCPRVHCPGFTTLSDLRPSSARLICGCQAWVGPQVVPLLAEPMHPVGAAEMGSGGMWSDLGVPAQKDLDLMLLPSQP